MQFFYLINGWAGRSAFADAALRLYYVSAVPLLATALAALLMLVPRPDRAPSRWRVAVATTLAALLCALTMTGVNVFAQHALGTDMLSPRPFLTHYVNALVVEPNDNSFPSPEAMLAATLAVMIWAAWPTAGLAATCAVLLFCFTRVFCGTNYPVDVGTGAMLGGAWGALSLALCRISLQIPSRDGRRLIWRARHQAVFSVLAVGGLAAFTLVSLAHMPHYGDKLRSLFHEQAATAAPISVSSGNAATQIAPLTKEATALRETVAHEGEGVSPLAPSAALPSALSQLGGHLPQTEAHLLHGLQALQLSHRLISVDAAQVRLGTSDYRCAYIRFEVRQEGVAERHRVAATAAQIVRGAFHLDPLLQNVDVAGVILNDPNRASARSYIFAVGAVPVLTASVARRNLHLAQGPQWANAPNVDGGLWLRYRSLLYVNPRVLPATAPRPPQPTPAPTPEPTVTPAPTVTPVPTATPMSPTPAPTLTPKPTLVPTATPRPVPTAKPHPVALPHGGAPVPAHKVPALKPLPRPTRPKPKPKSGVQPSPPRVAPRARMRPHPFVLPKRQPRPVSHPAARRPVARRPAVARPRAKAVYGHYGYHRPYARPYGAYRYRPYQRHYYGGGGTRWHMTHDRYGHYYRQYY